MILKEIFNKRTFKGKSTTALLVHCELSGIVVMKDGQTVSNATIVLKGMNGDLIGETKSNGDGEFYLEHIKPGYYIVYAMKDYHLLSKKEGVQLEQGLTKMGKIILNKVRPLISDTQ